MQTRKRFFQDNFRAMQRAVDEMARDEMLVIESSLLLEELQYHDTSSATFDSLRANEMGAYVAQRWPAAIAFLAGAYPVHAADLALPQEQRQLTEKAVFPRLGIAVALGVQGHIDLTKHDKANFVLAAPAGEELPKPLQRVLDLERVYLNAMHAHNAALPDDVVTQSLQTIEAGSLPGGR